jgi:hypothetical protein
MKTTVHLHHPPPPPARLDIGPAGRSTLRLGLVVSLVAAVLAVAVEAAFAVPVVLILVPVVIVGFALSWYASGHRTRRVHRGEPSA